MHALVRVHRSSPSGPIRAERPHQARAQGACFEIWLRDAEQLAELPKQSGSLWHGYRRGWATSRKHLPDVDVAAAGGWKSTETLRRCYQLPDEATVRRVVLEPVELRERQA